MSKQVKRRSESFWGIHTDFHAKPEEGIVVGETLKGPAYSQDNIIIDSNINNELNI